MDNDKNKHEGISQSFADNPSRPHNGMILKKPIKTLAQLYDDDKFLLYYNHIVEYNQRFNLTSITTREDVFLKHFYDSILPVELIPPCSSALDVGSGAGFPGICLKLVRPDISLTLIDSVGKKVSFLQDMINVLDLTNTRAFHCRIEDFCGINLDAYDVINKCENGGKFNDKSGLFCHENANEKNGNNCVFSGKNSTLSEKISNKNASSLGIKSKDKKHDKTLTKNGFDIAISRAVAATNILAEYCLPFVKLGGFALFYKSNTEAFEEELAAAKPAIFKLGGRIDGVYKMNLTDDIVRSFVMVKKVAETPPEYPRKGNKPRLNPIGGKISK